jgi:hypothetical protein
MYVAAMLRPFLTASCDLDIPVVKIEITKFLKFFGRARDTRRRDVAREICGTRVRTALDFGPCVPICPETTGLEKL